MAFIRCVTCCSSHPWWYLVHYECHGSQASQGWPSPGLSTNRLSEGPTRDERGSATETLSAAAPGSAPPARHRSDLPSVLVPCPSDGESVVGAFWSLWGEVVHTNRAEKPAKGTSNNKGPCGAQWKQSWLPSRSLANHPMRLAKAEGSPTSLPVCQGDNRPNYPSCSKKKNP